MLHKNAATSPPTSSGSFGKTESTRRVDALINDLDSIVSRLQKIYFRSSDLRDRVYGATDNVNKEAPNSPIAPGYFGKLEALTSQAFALLSAIDDVQTSIDNAV